jgi:hypothetical protein
VRSLLVPVALLLGAAAGVEAGPWGLGRGRVHAQVGHGRLRTSTLHAPDGTAFEIPDYAHDEIGAFVSVGLTDRVTAFVSLPAWRSADLEDFGSESGVGDLRVGVQLPVLQRGLWALAVRGTLQAPTGDETRAGGVLPTGTGVWEADGMLSVGRALSGGRGWAFLEAGHLVRGGQLRDSFVYAAQVGWSLSERLRLSAGLRGVEPYDSSARAVAIGSPTGLSDRVTYVAYGPGLDLRLAGPWTLHLRVEDTFHARNLATGPTVRTSVSWSR